jgi:hypothetical protein
MAFSSFPEPRVRVILPHLRTGFLANSFLPDLLRHPKIGNIL